MSTDNANEAAFPMYNELGNLHAEGLTKREYFAAMAMQQFINSKGVTTFDAARNTEGVNEDIAAASIAVADALLTQLNTQP